MKIINAKNLEERPATYLIYGAPGVGKTSTAKFFPGKTLIIDIDRTTRVLKGSENIDIVELDNINTWDSWESLVKDLVNNYKGQYQNIVIDNISELERCILSHLGRRGRNMGVPSQGDYQYMQFRIVNSIRYLKELGGNLIINAWEDSGLFTASNGQQFNRVYPQLNRKILNNIAGLCDVVARLTVTETEDGEEIRGFYLSPTDTIYAKNQLDDRKGCRQEELIINAEGVSERSDKQNKRSDEARI